MNYTRGPLAYLSFALLLVPGLAQEGKVIVEQPGAKELKRSAHRIRIPVEQLKSARSVLQEATDLARRLDPPPADSIAQLGQSWIQLNRTKAPGAIESLYSGLRAAAAKSATPQDYGRFTSASQMLLSSFAELDSEKALEYLRQWPAPPASLGEDGVRLRDQFESRFRNQFAQRMIYRNPAAAMKLMPALNASAMPDYSLRGQMALQLARNGRKEDAVKIADQVIADFQQRPASARSAQEYASFLQSLAALDPERFSDAFGMLMPALVNQPGAGYPATLQSGDQSVPLTPAESTLLNMFRGLQGRPQLALKTLDSLPDLRAKLDRVGGIDGFLNPGPGGSMNISYGPPGDFRMRNPPAAPAAGKDSVSSLYEELRGKARKDPVLVRSRLAEIESNPAQPDLLVALAQRTYNEDPELSSLALEVAVSRLHGVEPLQRRATTLQNLLGAVRQCEGEVDPELLRNGFIIADKLRQEEEKANPDSAVRKSGFGTQADQLEAMLVAEYARDNFDASMRFLKSKSDDNIKLMMMLRVLQALRSSY